MASGCAAPKPSAVPQTPAVEVPTAAEAPPTAAEVEVGPGVGEVVKISVPLLDGSLWQVSDPEVAAVGRWCLLIGSASDPELLAALDLLRTREEPLGVVLVLVDAQRDAAERVEAGVAQVGWDPEAVVALQLDALALPSAVMLDGAGTVQWISSPMDVESFQRGLATLLDSSP